MTRTHHWTEHFCATILQSPYYSRSRVTFRDRAAGVVACMQLLRKGSELEWLQELMLYSRDQALGLHWMLFGGSCWKISRSSEQPGSG